MGKTLDILLSFAYAIHMDEQIVPNDRRDQKRRESSTGDIPTPVIKRTFRLLDLLANSREGMSLSDLARTSQISKSSTHNLLKSLVQCGIVEQPDGRLYVLGSHIYHLAARVQETRLWGMIQPAMYRLAVSVGETIMLARLESSGVRVVEYVETESDSSTLRIIPTRGKHLPFPAGAHSRVVFASWPVEQRMAWLRTHELPRYTDRSILDKEQFLQAVEETARTGFAVDYEEYIHGLNAVAVPITGSEGVLAAVLFAFGLASTFHGDAVLRAETLLLEEAQSLSRMLAADI